MLLGLDMILESRKLRWNQLPSGAGEITVMYGTLLEKYLYKRTLAGPKRRW